MFRFVDTITINFQQYKKYNKNCITRIVQQKIDEEPKGIIKLAYIIELVIIQTDHFTN